jgi:hypothetical protein
MLDERACLTCHTFQNTCAECHTRKLAANLPADGVPRPARMRVLEDAILLFR